MNYHENINVSDVNELTLIVINANLKVKMTDRIDLFYDVVLRKGDSGYKPILKRINDKLEIRFQKKSPAIFGFIDFGHSNIVEEVHVELPNDKIGTLNIKNVSSDLNLMNLKTKYLNISGVSGDANMKNCLVETMNFSSVSGDLSVDDLNSKEINIRSVSGDLELLNIGSLIKKIIISTVSGDTLLNFSFTPFVDISMSSTSGEIKSNIPLYNLKKGRFTNFDPNGSVNDIVFIKKSSVSGDLKLEFKNQEKEEQTNVYTPIEEDEIQKVLRMIKIGILKRDEGMEILRTIGYSEDEINEIMEKFEEN